MKKSSFAALILGTVSGVFFALGMCMSLLPEWGMGTQGTICGVIGLVFMLVAVGVWRRIEGRAPSRISGKTIGLVFLGAVGALTLGVGMCLSMVFAKMLPGIVIGLMGIILLLMLIPLTKGIRD